MDPDAGQPQAIEELLELEREGRLWPRPLPTEVRVFNSENSTHYFIPARRDRLLQFYEFAVNNRKKTIPFSVLPGYSGLTVLGLSTIFTHIPSKFPIKDVITWLRNEQRDHLGYNPAPLLSSDEVCSALAHFGQLNTQLQGDGSEIL